MMHAEPRFSLTVAAAGDARTVRPTDDAAAGGWFCLDGHLWLRKIPGLSVTAALAKGGDPKKTETTEITFDLETLRLQASGATPSNWARVPEAQALVDRVAGHVDRALTAAIPQAHGPLPSPGATLAALPLPELDWPEPVRGKLARAILWLRRRTDLLGSTPRQARARRANTARNRALLQFDAGLVRLAPDAVQEAMPTPDQDVVRFAQRVAGLVQPMEVQIALTMAQDRTTVEVEMTQAGRIDLLAGVSAMQRTHSGLDVIRLDGTAREGAIAAYLLARLVIVARCFEASWVAAKPRLSITLTLDDLPGTLRACLTVGAQGWGFALAELALRLPELPAAMPEGLSLRMLPVHRVATSAAAQRTPVIEVTIAPAKVPP